MAVPGPTTDWSGHALPDELQQRNNGVFIGGGQIGGNYQIGQFVIGGEWDFDWAANNNNSAGVFVPGVGNIAVTDNNRWITTVAARFGWAIDHCAALRQGRRRLGRQ